MIEERFQELLTRYFDRDLEEQAQSELLAEIEANPEHRAAFIACYREHRALLEIHAPGTTVEFAREVMESLRPANRNFNRRLMESVRRRAVTPPAQRMWWVAAAGVAALLMLIFMVGRAILNDRAEHIAEGQPPAAPKPLADPKVAQMLAPEHADIGMPIFVAAGEPGAPRVTVIHKTGERAPLSLNNMLLAGDRVEAANAPNLERLPMAVLSLSGGKTLELAADTHVVIESAAFVTLERGMLFASVEKNGASTGLGAGVELGTDEYKLTLKTAHAMVGVKGTQFELSANAEVTRVRMVSGHVDFSNAEGRVTVGPFQESSARKGVTPDAPRSTAAATVWRGRKQVSNNAFLITNTGSVQPQDEPFVKRLEMLGFSVKPMRDDKLKLADLAGVSVLLISNTAGAERVVKLLGSVPMGLVCMDPGSFRAFGLTHGKENVDSGTTEIASGAVLQPGHFLSAGLSGSPTLNNGRVSVNFGIPEPGILNIVADPVDNRRSLVLACEAGATTGVGIAPARRVGLFVRTDTVPQLTSDGWALFDAAVLWSAGFAP